MKWQGKIINWNDDRGFGFVKPNGGGDRAFVHIKSFISRSHRPVNGDVIVYEIIRDKNNRNKAVNIRFAKDLTKLKNHKVSNNGSKFGFVFILCFFIVILVSTITKKLPIFVVGIYVVVSLITFIIYALDKSAAQSGSWRTKENSLHLLSLIGGWPGAYFAQNKLRHKSSKQEFKIVYRLTVLINLGFLFWLYTEKGKGFLNNINL